MVVNGNGTHIPLINSRIMLECSTLMTAFSISVNPYPKTADFANPFPDGEGRLGKSRVGIGK